ncbi:MAG: hypothetical protein RBS58_10155 [Syntrophales bacterium]|jgi:glucose-6-phosphate isomerase|nr:hypothetical protein [Syntrophales bacterium]
MKTTMRLSGFDGFRQVIDDNRSRLHKETVISRILQKDHTVWKADPPEIANRLGWLDAHRSMAVHVPRIKRFTDACRHDGFTEAILLGMGGSSCAPEVLRKTFSFRHDYLDLSILDSTDPGAILYRTAHMPPARTMALVATKSGTTTETLSLFRFFYNLFSEQTEFKTPGSHFTAITDPGTPLVDTAEQCSFRDIFLNDPNIGGRYSALSFFGLVPAALCGIDISYLLLRGEAAAKRFADDDLSESRNPAAVLGLLMGTLAMEGVDKLTLLLSPQIKACADWIEQLIAESLGKEGRGIVPVVHEPPAGEDAYGPDRYFVCLRLRWDTSLDDRLKSLEAAGFPVIVLEMEDLYELGGLFFLWQAATAVAGFILSVNPFDQPDVESSKALTRNMVEEFVKTGRVSEEAPSRTDGELLFFGDAHGKTLSDAFRSFVDGAEPCSYIALQAYFQPKTDTDRALPKLREAILRRTGRATTAGYGPRYLHSTGQMHKGGGAARFIQLTANDAHDVPIPDKVGKSASSLSFGVLKAAQARGDREALLNAGQPVAVIHLGDDSTAGLRILASALS